MKRLIAAILLSPLIVPPAYALRTRGADLPALQEEIQGGLEETPFIKLRGVLVYQRIVFGPHATAAALILAEVRKSKISQQEFTVLTTTPAHRDALIKRIKHDGWSGHIASEWIKTLAPRDDEFESERSVCERTLRDLQRTLSPDYTNPQILLVQGSQEPKIAMAGVTTIRIPIAHTVNDLRDMITRILRGCGVSATSQWLRAATKEFEARYQSYQRLEQNL